MIYRKAQIEVLVAATRGKETPMRDSDLQLLLIIAAVVIVIFVAKYFRLKARSQSQLNEFRLHLNERVQQEFDAWRSRQLETERAQLRQSAQETAKLDLERWRIENEGTIRADALRRSAAVVSGKVTEHLAPYMRTFPYNPKDARFLGTPVDLIVFDGMSEDAISEIIFLEIKSLSSTLTTRERRVRDAVVAKRVAWREFRVD